MTKITQNTLLPISLIASLCYIVFLVGTSYSEVRANKVSIERIQADSKDIAKSLKSIEARLVRIETLLAK